MPHIDYVRTDEASGAVREALEDYRDEHGERSLLRESVANHPPLLEATKVFFDQIMREGHLDRELKEIVAVVVSQANECDYCAPSHRESLIEVHGVSRELVDDVRNEEYDSLSPEYQAAVEFTETVVADPNRVTENDFEVLRDAGFDDQDAVEILGVVGLFMFTNTYARAVSIHPTDRDDRLAEY
jgi:uncharacterized peroxidase-related enzyme